MKPSQPLLCAFLGALLLLSSGCVELCGQRISIYHDDAQDKLYLLFHHDGIHDSGGTGLFSSDDALTELERFADQGGILLLEGPWNIWMDEVAELADREDLEPAFQAFGRAWSRSVKSIILGHYRDFDDRICATQLVIISNVSELLRRGNAAFSQYLGTELENEDYPDHLRRTSARLLSATRQNHQWIAIEGHSFRISFPAHSREWAQAKAEALKSFEMNPWPDAGHQLLAGIPVSMTEAGGDVSFRLGDPKKPSIARALLEREYNKKLEEAVIEHAPTPLDEFLAKWLLRQDVADKHPHLEAIVNLGPPEDGVRALVRLAVKGDEKSKARAIEFLNSFAKMWNEEEGIPEAPLPAEDMEEYLNAWRDWYRKMLAFPMERARQISGKPKETPQKPPPPENTPKP